MLSTQTVTCLELLGNGRWFKVPRYQRDYSWDEEQWEDLWSDLLGLLNNQEDKHYTGALVVQTQNDRELLVIDGQQRLATLSVLSLAVINQLHGLAEKGVEPTENRERAKELRNRFIGERDPASLVESSRLSLNLADDAFYQDYLVQLKSPPAPRALPRSNRLLWGCLNYFQDQLKAEFLNKGRGGKELARFLAETVGRQIVFILITVSDDLSAYTVFETLNARGVELTTTDLIKNYLFSRVRVQADADALQRRWQRLVATVAQERFPDFLRYHYLCEQPRVRSRQLFKVVRERVRDAVQAFELIDSLEHRAELFRALSDPDHEFWIERPRAKPYVRELVLFGVQQVTPLLFAAWERFDTEDFTSVLRAAAVVSFRYSVIGRLNPNELETAYHLAARAILDGTAKTPAQVFRLLEPIYVPDEQFKSTFEALSLSATAQRKKIARYILAKLESDLSGRSCDPDTDPFSVEHIFPENPSEEWLATLPRENWEGYVYRLGNLTLLEPEKNRKVGNSAYAIKRDAYAESIYALTQRVAEIAPEEWTPALAQRRQEEMAARAVHIWRLDFS